EPRPEDRQDGRGQGAEQRGNDSAGEDAAVVAPERLVEDPEEGRGTLDDIERQGSVREEVRVQLQRVERQPVHSEPDRALVGMEEVVLVPVRPEEPNGDSEEEQNSQPPTVSARFRHCFSLPFSEGTRISRYTGRCYGDRSRGITGIV